MAINTKKPKQKNLLGYNGFTLPPPPTTEMPLLTPAFAPQGNLQPQQPQADSRPFVPANLPPMPAAPQRSDYQASPDVMQSYKDLIETLRTQNNSALADANSTQGYLPDLLKAGDNGGMVPTTPANPFEQKLGEATKAAIIQNLARKEGPGSRFHSGFTMGQQLAANVALPLLGLFGGGPGTAFGAMQTAQNLEAQVAQERSAQRAEKNARNQTLMSLANLYENISPESSKNVRDLLGHQIQIASANKALKTQRQNTAHQTTQALGTAQKELLTLDANANKEFSGAQHQYQDLLNKRTGVDEGIQRDLFNAGTKNTELGNQEHRLKNEDLKIAQGDKRISAMEAKNSNSDAIAQDKVKMEALQQLERTFRLNKEAMDVTGAGGQKKYGTYGDFLKQNPAMRQIVAGQMKAAGITASPDEVMKAFLGDGEAPKPGGGNWFDDLLAGAKKLIPGMVPAEDALGEAKRRGLKQVNGVWQVAK